MRVSEVMTREVRVANPNETIQEAARLMAEIDAGVVPVGDNDRLVGMLTDRDIAIRAVAKGKGPDTKVSDIMTREVKYCFEDEDSDRVCQNSRRSADLPDSRRQSGQAARRDPLAGRSCGRRRERRDRRDLGRHFAPRRTALSDRRHAAMNVVLSTENRDADIPRPTARKGGRDSLCFRPVRPSCAARASTDFLPCADGPSRPDALGLPNCYGWTRTRRRQR